jgi:hypothetical protein
MEETYYTRDGIISDVMHRIIISNHEETLSGDIEDTAISSEDTQSDSTHWELQISVA